MHSCTHSRYGNHNCDKKIQNPCPHIEPKHCHCDDKRTGGMTARHTVGLAVLCKNRGNTIAYIRALFFYDNSQNCYSDKHTGRHNKRLQKQISFPQKCIYKQNRVVCKYKQRKKPVYEFQYFFCGFIIFEKICQFNILFTVNFLHLPEFFTLRF